MRWTPRFVFNDGEARDITLLLPIGLWRHGGPAIGGDIDSDAGVPASFVVRRTYTLAIPLRFYESEWPDIRALVEHGQAAGAITWYPDVEEPENFDVYLEFPEVGEDIVAEPDGEYLRALSLTIVIRRTNDAKFDTLEYFTEAA